MYIQHVLRDYKDCLPQRREARMTRNGDTSEVNCIWEDNQKWLEVNIDKKAASRVISVCEGGAYEQAFKLLKQMGMPTVDNYSSTTTNGLV